jgi:3'(2'), 5'-bisphosphate nucleotidase
VPSDDALAADLATAAGALLLDIRERYDDPRDAGDRLSNEHLLSALEQHRPDDAVLSEESDDDTARLSSARVWILDPLDGTREFGEAGRDDWAVHVALWQAGELTAGAVALPAQGVTLSTADVLVAGAPYADRPRLVVSRTRAPALVTTLAERLDADLIPLGSAGAKAMAVVQGHADAYVHGGGIYEWDTAAPVAVARAAGLHTSHLDGSPLAYNQRSPLQEDLLICRPDLAGRMLEAIKGVS